MNTHPVHQQMNLRTWCKCPVHACKQAGCETISACKWASLQQSSRSQPTAGPCSRRSLAGGHILTQCFVTHKCVKQRPVLWSQPRPNILLPSSAQCSPKTFPSCGLRHTETAPCHLNGCKPPLFSIQFPWIPKAQRGERKPGDPTRRVCSEQPGQHQWLLQGKAQLNLCPYSGISEQLLRNKTHLPSFRWSFLNPLRLRESD